ncbi:transposable element Tcb2 transposase [Trichonephila clavipes]|uniref:Transposable element Tcb2 transposase n=1 Tax=Trichonephila clavipes TaxID=2585209 RepID=A0A8X6SVA8_TRICX|nr:transposable element Tcb2 transposase [Trichonephila clavipes]
MGKLPDLDAFDRGQIVRARRMGHLISEIVRRLGFSRSTVSRVYQECMEGGQKTSDWVNCTGKLSLTVPEDWKRVAWSDESRFRLLNADGRLRIWCQAHEARDPACQVGTVQGHGD